MLSPDEFTVGALGSAQPLSLVLPRTKYEETILIGHIDQAPTAVFLSKRHAFKYFRSAENKSWKGLIVPDVRVEVDETSIFDPQASSHTLGVVIRTDTQLAIWAKSEDIYDSPVLVTLHDGLTPTVKHEAGFSGWQIVIGKGPDKRILWQSSNEA